MVADRRDALQPPARADSPGVEEQRLADRRILEILVDDLGDRHRSLPLLAVAGDPRPRLAADERELAALEQHPAIGAGEAAAAIGAVGDHLADRQLAGQRLALRFEIDAGGEAFEFAAPSRAAANSNA